MRVHRGADPRVARGPDGQPRLQRAVDVLAHQRRRTGRRGPHQRQQLPVRAAHRAIAAQVVVVEEAEPLRDVEAAAPRRQRLRDHDDVAGRIADGEGRGAAADALALPLPGRVGVLGERQRVRRIDAPEQRGGVRRIEVRRDLDRPQRRIGDAPQRIAHLPRLDHVMQVVGRVAQQRATRRAVAIQDLQRLDQRRPGGHRRRRAEDRQARGSARTPATARSPGTARDPRGR